MHPIRCHPANAQTIAAAAHALKAGRLVAFPTETVYGLGADARNDLAVARVFEAKGRPQFNPLIVHVADLEAAQTLGMFKTQALKLAERFWPGPLTLVVPRKGDCGISRLASAGLDTLALRVPANSVARNLLTAFGGPIAAPSANRSGALSPTRAEHVQGLGAHLAMILDGGACAIGLESTIVALSDAEPVLLRPGGLAREEIEAVVGTLLSLQPSDRPSAPGQLSSHYAPRAGLRLNADIPDTGEAFLAFGPQPLPLPPNSLNLSLTGDLVEAAANLFAHLHQLDQLGVRTIAVAHIPMSGLGEAINDRLLRAAAPREI
ncbi:MAG TPA: threonylcarbamoyl-AMP synthase [Alphaproteobacteria bacterium]|nr:threonylcarbamoyl-AMP synthase [Alphaproteobacteria bacterium]HAJ46315.1 threonylcarbamoyl-AMP synthase [Alphaproteobacteria bacterium]